MQTTREKMSSLSGTRHPWRGQGLRTPWAFLVAQWQAIDTDFLETAPHDDGTQTRDHAQTQARLAICIVVASLCLALQRYFGTVGNVRPIAQALHLASDPAQLEWIGRLYWAGFKSISYILIPWMCIRFVLKEKLSDHGFHVHRSRPVFWIYTAMITIAVAVAYIASFSPAFLHKYPLFHAASQSPLYFWTWEIAYGFQFAALEFFFRGFLLFALARKFGYVAIFVAILPYSMIHFTKPFVETLGSMLGGIALGTLSLRTRSIYGGVIAHCVVGWSMDFFALWRKDLLHALVGFSQ